MSSIEGKDPEADAGLASHLANDVVKTFSWNAIRVVVKDRKSKQPLPILDDAAGHLLAGEMLAIMGPSGSGKTTLLNTLAHRVAAAGASTSGTVSVNGLDADTSMIRHLSSYVEQEDALIGSITVRETVAFAAKLSLPRLVSSCFMQC
jgi:ABC-type multidrug transport system ATPase subunit